MAAERVRAWGALCSLRSEKKLSAEEWRETHLLPNEENERSIKDYLERESAVARKRVQDAETVIMQEQEDMNTAENTGVTTIMQEKKFEEMLNSIGDSLSDLASSNNEQDGEDEEDVEEDTELGKLSDDDDEPG